MSQLSELELKEIENFTQAAGTLFTGLIMDESAQGTANANSVISHLYGQGLPLTMANLTASVVALQWTLFWKPGTEPVPVSRDTRTRAQKAVDGGIRPYAPSGYVDAANGVESSWAKEVREGKEANAKRLAAKAKADERFRETHQTVMTANGRISYAQSEIVNAEARRRHAAEDAQEARAAGKPIPVAATTKVRLIPAGTTDFTGYSAEELKAYLARSKGRAGEPHGSLLR